METDFLLKLEFPGFVVFDPFSLDKFLLKHKITESDILNYFMENPNIGDSAVEDGIIFPIYNIIEEDYIIKTTKIPEYTDFDLFTYKSFPLRITNNSVIIADIYALINWNAALYKSLAIRKVRDIPSRNAFFIESGDYSVDITGFFIDEKQFGYGITFNPVQVLPRSVGIRSNIYEYNFNVVELFWAGGMLNIKPY